MELKKGVHSSAAALLERRKGDILVAFEAALQSTGPSFRGEQQRTQPHPVQSHLAEARFILTQVISELDRGAHPPQGSHCRTDASRPHGPGAHPAESGRAAAALFDAVSAVLVDELDDVHAGAAETAFLLSLLHRRIVARHTARSLAHIDHLLERIRSAHHDERRRIARELHDGVAGQLSTALNWFELHELHERRQQELARQKLHAARSTVRDSLSSLREVMTGLRQRTDTASLRTALTRDLESVRGHGAEVRVSVTGDESWLPPGAAEELLLIVREAQRNAVRHSRATSVTVDVHVAPGEACAVVADDGVGFDPAAAAPRGHSGMLSMRERAELFGGSVTVESQPGRGARVLVFLPLEGDKSAESA